MAIKGKKKSQSRGSQARRRPAAAPRPVVGKGTKKRWYQTTAGQSIAAIGTLVVIVVALVLVNNARTEARELEQRQETLENFTDQVKALTETLSGPATDLAAAGQTPPDDLGSEAEGWRDAFTAAQAQAAQLPPAEGTTTVQQLISQALSLYRGAATVLIQADAAEDEARTELLAVATSQTASAESVWQAAVEVLDTARDDAEMNASGARSPAGGPAAEMPAAEATIPVETDEGSGGNGGQGGKKKKGDDS